MAISNDNGKDDDASAAVPSLQRRAAVRTGFGFKRQEGERNASGVLFISKGKKGVSDTKYVWKRVVVLSQLEMESASSFLAKKFCTTCEPVHM